jgi:hypothetical protein
VPKKSLDFALVHPHSDAFGHCTCRRQPFRLSDQASFTHEFVNTQDRDDGFFALLGYDSNFELALFNIENRIGGFALRKDNFVLAVL